MFWKELGVRNRVEAAVKIIADESLLLWRSQNIPIQANRDLCAYNG